VDRRTNATIDRPRLRLGIFRSSLFGPLPAIPILAASRGGDAGRTVGMPQIFSTAIFGARFGVATFIALL
jgi:hypothetical protein